MLTRCPGPQVLSATIPMQICEAMEAGHHQMSGEVGPVNAEVPGDSCMTLNKSLDLLRSFCRGERPAACQFDRVYDRIIFYL